MESWKPQRGVVAVEFALLLVPLLVILTGITEFGRAMYYYNTMAKSVRDATRLMSTRTPADADYATVWASAQCSVVYGNPGCTGDPLVPGLTAAMVSVSHLSVAPYSLVRVTVSGYTFESLAAFKPALFGVASFSFGPISVTMREPKPVT